jgi:hypothetical protein
MACLFTVHVGSILSPFSSGVFLTPPLLQNFPLLLLGRCRHSCLLQPSCLFTVPVGSAPSLLSSGVFLTLPLLQDFLLQDCWAGAATPAFSDRLVYLQFCEGLPLPPSLVLRAPHPLCYMSFCCCCYSVCFLSLFFLGGSQSIQGAMLIWPKVCCKSTTCRLPHLEVCISQASRKWHLAAWEPSWFIHLQRSGDAMCGLGVWRSQRFASSWWFFL